MPAGEPYTAPAPVTAAPRQATSPRRRPALGRRTFDRRTLDRPAAHCEAHRKTRAPRGI